jgi:TctA family transporter
MSFIDATSGALGMVFTVETLSYLILGVLLGLTIGLIPGMGGVVGLSILLPFIFDAEAMNALAMMIGLVSVTSTSDTVPAVLFGVPGTAAAQSTIMDGYPLSRQGQAGRALGAAYASSLLGGLAGTVFVVMALPFLRPIVLSFGSPELFALGILGITMIAVLAGKHPVKGLVAGALGVLIGLIGVNIQSGFLRWTGGNLYLFDGLPLPVIGLGLFAIPEIWDMVIQGSHAVDSRRTVISRVRDGLRDVRENLGLIIRCGVIGTFIGAVPGVGSSLVGWLTYSYAKQTVKGGQETFGTGDIRGVIAPESANNAVDAGDLVPTLAFGVPGSASMALVLVGMIVVGIQPGPDMLHGQLDTTMAIIMFIPLANLLGSGIMFSLSSQVAKLAALRAEILAPLVVAVVVLAAYQTSRSWGDLWALMGFAALGFLMKRNGWPRPPLLLGFVLSLILEKYFFITIAAYSPSEWLLRPIVVGILLTAVATLVYSVRLGRKSRLARPELLQVHEE